MYCCTYRRTRLVQRLAKSVILWLNDWLPGPKCETCISNLIIGMSGLSSRNRISLITVINPTSVYLQRHCLP